MARCSFSCETVWCFLWAFGLWLVILAFGAAFGVFFVPFVFSFFHRHLLVSLVYGDSCWLILF